MKACFCVRSIFCAIQSSWISAMAGVSTMVAATECSKGAPLELAQSNRNDFLQENDECRK